MKGSIISLLRIIGGSGAGVGSTRGRRCGLHGGLMRVSRRLGYLPGRARSPDSLGESNNRGRPPLVHEKFFYKALAATAVAGRTLLFLIQDEYHTHARGLSLFNYDKKGCVENEKRRTWGSSARYNPLFIISIVTTRIESLFHRALRVLCQL